MDRTDTTDTVREPTPAADLEGYTTMTTNDTITADEQQISPDAAAISSGDRSPKRAARVATALADDRGAQTAEYGILTLAAVGFAGLLGVVLSGGDVQGLLTDLVTEALNRE